MLVNARPVAKGGESHRPASGGKLGCLLAKVTRLFRVSASGLRLLFDSLFEAITGPNRLINAKNPRPLEREEGGTRHSQRKAGPVMALPFREITVLGCQVGMIICA